MIYDDDILFGKTADTPGSPRLQIKEVLGIGLQVPPRRRKEVLGSGFQVNF